MAAVSVAVHDGDAYVWLVATRPEARGRGLAGELLRAALRAARDQAGAATTTLEATAMGEASTGAWATATSDAWGCGSTGGLLSCAACASRPTPGRPTSRPTSWSRHWAAARRPSCSS